MARILIVDDDPVFLSMVSDALHQHAASEYQSDWDLRVTLCKDALAALEHVNIHAFELIITDIMMARMDGWEFIREIRKRFPQFDVPIVVVSAIDGIELKYEGMRHGASAWFHKPINPESFSKEIFRLVQER